ncbi:hypothetical protein EBZ39_11265, partial [bacterium]|nr:hypothetical protein [bacterium]
MRRYAGERNGSFAMLFSPQRCFLLLFLSSFYAPLLPAPIVLQAYFIICDDAGRPLDLAYLSAQQRQALASVLYDYATRSGARWEVRSVHDAAPPTQRSWSVRRVLAILAWLLLASGVLYASYHWYQHRQRLAQPEAPPEQVAPPEPLLVVAPAVVALDVPPLAMQLMDMQQP